MCCYQTAEQRVSRRCIQSSFHALGLGLFFGIGRRGSVCRAFVVIQHRPAAWLAVRNQRLQRNDGALVAQRKLREEQRCRLFRMPLLPFATPFPAVAVGSHPERIGKPGFCKRARFLEPRHGFGLAQLHRHFPEHERRPNRAVMTLRFRSRQQFFPSGLRIFPVIPTQPVGKRALVVIGKLGVELLG